MYSRKYLAAACSAGLLVVATVLPGYAQSVPTSLSPTISDIIALPPQPCDPGGIVPAGYNLIVGTGGSDVLVGTPGKILHPRARW
jgi:hypothetical protein